MATETDLLWRFIPAAPIALPDVRVFRRDIINTVSVVGYRVRNGIVGQADAYAMVRGGLHVELETKAARGTMREAQERWRAYCERFQIPHLVLRAQKGEPPDTTVARWVSELGTCIEEARTR